MKLDTEMLVRSNGRDKDGVELVLSQFCLDGRATCWLQEVSLQTHKRWTRRVLHRTIAQFLRHRCAATSDAWQCLAQGEVSDVGCVCMLNNWISSGDEICADNNDFQFAFEEQRAKRKVADLLQR